MTPTPEQSTILSSFLSHPCLIINAGPGCGKSTTLAMGVTNSVPKTRWPRTLAVAFNRDATDALRKKLPSTVNVSTLNSLGLSLWTSYRGHGPGKPNTKKTREIISEIRQAGRWSIAPEELEDFLTLTAMAKSQGYGPPKSGGHFEPIDFKSLCHLADVTPTPSHEHILHEILRKSIDRSFADDMDFEDQIYMAACFTDSSIAGKYKLILVDEAQDLSPLQLRLLRRCNANNYVFVGDPLQAIYAFRGAMSDAMQRIYTIWPDAVTLPLQTSFRLPKDIVSLLSKHNPSLTTNKTAWGSVKDLTQDPYIFNLSQTLTNLATGTTKAILCRNNAPLFKIALYCIAHSIPFNLANKQFGQQLIREIKYVCRSVGLRGASSDWVLAQLYTHWFYDNPAGLERDLLLDRYNTCKSIAERCSTAESMCLEITSLNRVPNPSDKSHPLHLSTAHKAKGLEFDWVVHLDPHLIPSKFATTPEELKQEANAAYVINSRSLYSLTFLRSDQILIPGSETKRQPRTRTRYQEPL